jgi:hypothetical protein
MSIFDFTNYSQNCFVICRILVHNLSPPLPAPSFKTEKKEYITVLSALTTAYSHKNVVTAFASYYSGPVLLFPRTRIKL